MSGSLPKVLAEKAASLGVEVGRLYDSTGKHCTYYYQVDPTWRVYRHSVSGMLALLRHVARDRKIEKRLTPEPIYDEHYFNAKRVGDGT